MKTSVILSTFAALCLMITFGEAPTRQTSLKNNTTSIDPVSYKTTSLMKANPEEKPASNPEKAAAIKTAAKLNEDLNYLKFVVTDYTTETTTELNDYNLFDYLKFNFSDFAKNSDLTTNEALEIPINDFEYLKFNVNDNKSSETESYEDLETPVSEFEYLKFNVNNYAAGKPETMEMPVNE